MGLVDNCFRWLGWGGGKVKSKGKPAPHGMIHKNIKGHENVRLIFEGRIYPRGLKIQNDGSSKCHEVVEVKIGEGFHCGQGCEIRTSDHDFENGYPMVHGSVAGYKAEGVCIGKYVWLGSDVLIMKGVTIGDGAVIQARSVVVSDIPPLALAGGHPCKIFGFRDEAQFQALKALGITHIKRNAEGLDGHRKDVEAIKKRHGPAFRKVAPTS